MTGKERPIPAATSPLAGPVVLRASVGPLKVGDQAPAQAPAPAAEETKVPAPPRAATKRRPSGRRPAPAVSDAVALTVRLEPGEALDVDRWMVELRWQTGQRLDKSEVIRELLRMAREQPQTQRSLVRRLGVIPGRGKGPLPEPSGDE